MHDDREPGRLEMLALTACLCVVVLICTAIIVSST